MTRQRVVGWIQVEADNVPHLLDEQRVVGDLERFHDMWLQPEGAPDAAHGGGADASALRHLAGAPVGPSLRLTFQRGDEDRLDIRIGQCPGGSGLGLVIQRIHATCRKPLPPLADRHIRTAQFRRDPPRSIRHARTSGRYFARKATCRFVLARLASRSSSPRSTAVTSNLALGRPVLAMPPNTSHPAHFVKLFQTQGTRLERQISPDRAPSFQVGR